MKKGEIRDAVAAETARLGLGNSHFAWKDGCWLHILWRGNSEVKIHHLPSGSSAQKVDDAKASLRICAGMLKRAKAAAAALAT